MRLNLTKLDTSRFLCVWGGGGRGGGDRGVKGCGRVLFSQGPLVLECVYRHYNCLSSHYLHVNLSI